MAERKKLFRLELERFREASNPLSAQHPNCFRLQHEFKSKKVSLSPSLLIWREQSGDSWLLADFEYQKTYEIDRVEGTDGNYNVDVLELPNQPDNPVNLTDTKAILLRLQSAQGTDQGFIDFLKRLNLDELDLKSVKRSDLAGAGFSFELAHQELLIVYNMLREILVVPREWLLNFPKWMVRDVVRQHLQQFYEKVKKIAEFEIVGENPKQTHDNLIEEVSQFCDEGKDALRPIITFLSSRKVTELAAEVNNTVTAAVNRLDVETNRANENNSAVDKKRAEWEEDVTALKAKMQDQLAKESVSQYKALFENQAEHYRIGAKNWLIMAGAATAVFFFAFACLAIWLKPQDSGLAAALQNLFAKGFLLSPIYVWLNRSIKNYTAQKHLEVINTHRQKALDTFDAFVAAAEGNKETRDAVLLAATDAIFDANQTGYLSTKSTGSDSRSPIQQIIREIIPKPTKGDG